MDRERCPDAGRTGGTPERGGVGGTPAVGRRTGHGHGPGRLRAVLSPGSNTGGPGQHGREPRHLPGGSPRPGTGLVGRDQLRTVAMGGAGPHPLAHLRDQSQAVVDQPRRRGPNGPPAPPPPTGKQLRLPGRSPMTDLTRLDDGPVATVYSGHRAGVPVALKVFPKRFDKRTASSFSKEQAKLSAVRRVTSILMVDGVEELPSGESAVRMELCTQSLAALVERVGPLPAADVAILGRAMATALAAAHSVGVVHGGVAPSNVLFRQNNEPVLADFGVTLRQAFTRDPLHAIEYLPPETL